MNDAIFGMYCIKKKGNALISLYSLWHWPMYCYNRAAAMLLIWYILQTAMIYVDPLFLIPVYYMKKVWWSFFIYCVAGTIFILNRLGLPERNINEQNIGGWIVSSTNDILTKETLRSLLVIIISAAYQHSALWTNALFIARRKKKVFLFLLYILTGHPWSLNESSLYPSLHIWAQFELLRWYWETFQVA